MKTQRSCNFANTLLRSIWLMLPLVGLLFWGLVGTSAAAFQQSEAATNGLELGDRLPNFQLKDAAGKPVDSTNWIGSKKLTAVVFVGVECPLVQFYSRRLEDFQNQFQGKLRVVGINANRHDSLAEISAFTKQLDVTFPVLKDIGNAVADQFGAQRTPEVFLFNQSDRLVYHGLIDDQHSYGQQRPSAKANYLRDAIEATLANEPIKTPSTEPIGCLIGRLREPKPDARVTYANQISRLLNKHCVSCHREGEIAPFALTDYDEVVGWAEMIQEVTAERRMPPWHANPAHGKFSNDISLSPKQTEMIAQWVADGAPLGDRKDLPEPPKFEDGWQIGTPDVVVAMAKEPQVVPATGVIPYQYFKVDPGFKEDKWIQAAECRIGNRRVVHHIIVGIRGPSGKLHGQIDSEWITATAPGSPPLVLEEGYAKLIPAGSILVFQMHYTPCGIEQSDLSKVGFKFADPKTVKKTVGTREVINQRFRIPPGAANHPVEANFTFKDDALILSMFPHMHLRGKSFSYTAHYPDGTEETLLDIPAYDFNWQNGYKYGKPKLMPAGTRLHCLAHFDNSENNFANPAPDETVTWGDQTTDEMMIGYFDMALANQDLTKQGNSPRTMSVLNKIQRGEKLIDRKMKKLASTSLKNNRNLTRFGAYLATQISNLDRIDVVRNNGEQMSISRLVQRPEFNEVVGSREATLPAEASFLNEILSQGRPKTIQDLGQIQTQDATHMRKAFRSSLHFPAELDGKSVLLNFWSTEAEAFPQELETVIHKLANMMTDE